MHLAPGAAALGSCPTGSRSSDLPRPHCPALLSKSYSQSSLRPLWGSQWSGSLVLCHCNNAAVLTQVNRLHSRDPKASHMLKCLAFLQAVYDCRVRAIHAAGVNNHNTDALSHNRVGPVLASHSQAFPNPTQVPLAYVRLVCQQAPD